MKKKYSLGTLTVTDRKQIDRNEIIIEIIDRMQRYVDEAKNCANNFSLSLEERYNGVKRICGRFCGLSEFLNITLDIDVRNCSMLYTQEMFNRIYYFETNLETELERGRSDNGRT